MAGKRERCIFHRWRPDMEVADGTAPKNYRVSGDVSLAYDASGHAILCYIAFDKLGSTNYWAQGARATASLSVARLMAARPGSPTLLP